MRFMLVLKQSAGCDYTIGCGIKMLPLAAVNETDAYQEARSLFYPTDDELEEGVTPEFTYSGDPGSNESAIESVELIELVSRVILPLNEWSAIEQAKWNKKDNKSRKKRRAQYEKLRAEFESEDR